MTLADMVVLDFEVVLDVPFAFFAGVTIVIVLEHDVWCPKGEVAPVTVLQTHRRLRFEVIAGIGMMAPFHVSPLRWLPVYTSEGRAMRIRAVDCAVMSSHVRHELFELTEAYGITT